MFGANQTRAGTLICLAAKQPSVSQTLLWGSPNSLGSASGVWGPPQEGLGDLGLFGCQADSGTYPRPIGCQSDLGRCPRLLGSQTSPRSLKHSLSKLPRLRLGSLERECLRDLGDVWLPSRLGHLPSSDWLSNIPSVSQTLPLQTPSASPREFGEGVFERPRGCLNPNTPGSLPPQGSINYNSKN